MQADAQSFNKDLNYSPVEIVFGRREKVIYCYLEKTTRVGMKKHSEANSAPVTDAARRWNGKKLYVPKTFVRHEIDSDFRVFARRSYEELRETERLNTTPLLEDRIFFQSVLGHARSGHVGFRTEEDNGFAVHDRSYKYPNATMWDVAEALNCDVDFVLEFTESTIKEIERYLGDLVDFVYTHRDTLGKATPTKSAIHGYKGHEFFAQRVLGQDKLRFTPQQAIQVISGAYFGGTMDSAEWRTRAEDTFEHLGQMHKGTVVPTRHSQLKELGITLEDLASGNYHAQIGLDSTASSMEIMARLAQLGVNPAEQKVRTTQDVQPAYVQFSPGSGTSDDTAFLYVGLTRGIGGLFGTELVDKVDTLEKFTALSVHGGYDEHITNELKRYWEDRMQAPFPVTDAEALALIRVAAKEPKYRFKVSSSQRYFHSIQNNTTAFVTHGQWLRDLRRGRRNDARPIEVGFERARAPHFYTDVYDSLVAAVDERVLIDNERILSGKKNPDNNPYTPKLAVAA